MVGIYKIENLINHKCYIGQSVRIKGRWRDEILASKNQKDKSYEYPLQRAMRKYGINNFSFEILELCPRIKLNERERYWVKFYDSYYNGYNQTEGGDNAPIPQKLQPEQIKEIYNYLLNTSLTNQEIANLFLVSENIISGINTGYYWYNDEYQYPIRKQYRKEKNYCIDCGIEITFGAKRCPKCYSLARRVVERPIKEQLEQELKETEGAFTKIGNKYGVNDNTIRKWCKSYNLPFHTSDYKKPKEVKKENKISSLPIKVQQIDKKTNEIIATYSSIKEAERITGIYHITQASDPNNTSRKTAGGYIWKRI